MKNRPTSARSHSHGIKKPGAMASIKTLVASGFGLIGIGSLLLLTFFVSQNSINQSQDVGSKASIEQGKVKISQGQSGQPKVNVPHTVLLSLNTGTTKVDEVALLFDVITETTGEVTIVEGSPNYMTYTIEKDDVDHGYKVLVTAKPKNAAAGIITNNQPMDFIKVSFTPNKEGPFTLAYDREKSKALVAGKDELTHLDVLATYIEGTTPPAAYPNPEDFSLLTDNLETYTKFYETSGSRNEVNPRQLVKDRTYTVRHTARIQNINEVELIDNPVIVNQLKVNNTESVTRTFQRSALLTSTSPLELQFETTFKAKEANTIQVLLDSNNSYLEVNEKNNSAAVSYTTSSTVKACNELCSSNAQCADNYTCHDLGSEKRCRLSTNLTSTACSADPDKRNLSCNQACTDNNQCGNGLTCFENRCRNSYNTGNTSCANPSSVAQQQIKDSCNKACSDNRGCANNMRCFNGSCRLATNPSSTSCTAASAPTVTQNYTKGGQPVSAVPTATPQPTATPRATATPRPSATATASAGVTPTLTATPEPTMTPTPTPVVIPEPTPEPQPNETVMDTLMNRINGWLSSENKWAGSLLTGALLPLIIIGAGVVLLIIAIVIVLKPAKRAPLHTDTAATYRPTIAPKPELHAKPNPPPPPIPGHGVIVPQKTAFANGSGSSVTATAIKQPDIIEAPPTAQPEVKPELPKPAAYVPTQVAQAPSAPPVTAPTPAPVNTPPAPTTQVADAPKPEASMLERLRSKGINLPEKQDVTITPPTSSGDSQPPSSGWPEDNQK